MSKWTLSLNPTERIVSYDSLSFYWSLGLAVCFHMALISWLYFSLEPKKVPLKSPSRLAVKTLDLKPRMKDPAEIKPAERVHKVEAPKEQDPPKPSNTPSPPRKEAPAKKASQPKAKNVVKKSKAPAKPSAKPDAQKKPTAVPKKILEDNSKRDLLAKAQASMSQIQAPTPAKSLSLKPLEAYKSLAFADVETQRAPHEIEDYQQELTHYLKLILTLPEAGSVTLDITLDRAGKVKKVTFIESGSAANKKYLEKTLPPLPLPPFGIYFKGVEVKTFRLELRGDIS